MEHTHTRRQTQATRPARQAAAALVALTVLLAGADATPGTITPDKLPLIPDIWPKDRRALHAKLHPVYMRGGDVTPLLREHGVHAEFLSRLADAPSGPLLANRLAHGATLAAPFLKPEQRAILEVLVPGVDGAQRALHQLKTRWTTKPQSLSPAEGGVDVRLAIAELDRAILEIEKRFWRVVGYTLTPAQRHGIHPLLPQTHTIPSDILGHVYQLPGFTASQATRVQAYLEQYQSESAADAAALQRTNRAAAAPNLSAEEKAKLQAEALRLGTRVEDLYRRVVEDSVKIYTPAQLTALDSIPPHVTPAERLANPAVLLQGMVLSADQRKKIDALGKKLAAAYAPIDKEFYAKHAKLQGSEMGNESPQSMNMAMVYHGAVAKKVAVNEEIAREAVLRVLRPDQLLAWVVSP